MVLWRNPGGLGNVASEEGLGEGRTERRRHRVVRQREVGGGKVSRKKKKRKG